MVDNRRRTLLLDECHGGSAAHMVADAFCTSHVLDVDGSSCDCVPRAFNGLVLLHGEAAPAAMQEPGMVRGPAAGRVLRARVGRRHAWARAAGIVCRGRGRRQPTDL